MGGDTGSRSHGPKVHRWGMVIARSNLNRCLTLKKVNLVSSYLCCVDQILYFKIHFMKEKRNEHTRIIFHCFDLFL